MNGDAFVWMILILPIVICDGLAIYLYRKWKIPIWLSAIGMALLVPVIFYSFISYGMWYMERYEKIHGYQGGDGTGVAFAGGFLAVTLGLHAIIVFVIGVIFNIYTFIKNKLKASRT